MSKYLVSLPANFTAPRRRRAGIEVARGAATEMDLTDEQVAALEADPFILVREVKAKKAPAKKPAVKKDKPTEKDS